MKIKVCDSAVYLHAVGRSVHIDIEHPFFVRIIDRGERAFCQGKSEHGIFVALNREMAGKARDAMAEMVQARFRDAWQEIVGISREIGWEKVREMMTKAEHEVASTKQDQDEEEA